jgi:hypothetical protein
MGKNTKRRIPLLAILSIVLALAAIVAVLLVFIFPPRLSRPRPIPAEYLLPAPEGLALETVDPPGRLPSIGKWLISPAGKVANWLGQRADGREVMEPINVIILDPQAKSGEEAETRLLAACAAAGFAVRSGHSSGYGGILDGFVYPELPRGPGDCFSDQPFVLPNDHGRIFGPHSTSEGWLFSGAFSREGIRIGQKIPHVYESMNRARDAFARGMTVSAGYELVGFVDLGNAILGDRERGSGDHDGIAVFVRATR